MRRLLASLGLGGVLAVAVLVLYGQGRAGLEAERKRLVSEANAAQLAVLEAIRQDVGSQLQSLIERESVRPYYQYERLYVPPNLVANSLGLEPSPLTDSPKEPLVRVYFQYREQTFIAPSLGASVQIAEAQDQVVNPYAEQAASELKDLDPAAVMCSARLEEDDDAEPLVMLIDPLIAHSNRNLSVTLQEMADAQADLTQGPDNSPVKQQALNMKWQGYQNRGGNTPGGYNKTKQRKEPTPQEVRIKVYPFKTLPVPPEVLKGASDDAPGADPWPSQLLVTRRVEQGDEAWLQGFSVNLDQIRDTILPGAITRLAERVKRKQPTYYSRSSFSSEAAPPLVEVMGTVTATALPGAVTLPLLEPFQQLSLVMVEAADPADALTGSRVLLNGALALIALVILAGSAILLVAARGQRKLAQQRADFVAALTHELKAPLTGVRALAELLHDGIITDEDKKQEYYASMLSECDRLSRLIHNVLSAARLERGALPVLLEPLDPLPTLGQLGERFGTRFDTLGFGFELVLPKRLPLTLADREGLDHIVANLLDNAAKYGLGATKLVRLEAVEEERALLVVVADRGPGIPEALREKVFGRFFRSPDVPREVGGAGLGLAIARAHAVAQGGDLRACTNPGGGARFELRLPLAPVDPAP